MAKPKAKRAADVAITELRAWGLATFPGAHTKSPWPGHLDLAVKDKTLAYSSIEGDPFSVGCKLPHSNDKALLLPGVTPTHYGLGKRGWVTPLDLLKDWIKESYRAQAPKKLVAELDAGVAPRATKKAPAHKKAPAAKKALMASSGRSTTRGSRTSTSR